MKIADLFRRSDPKPTAEALEAFREVKQDLKPRAEAADRERRRLLRENNFAPRIGAVYRGEV